MALSDEERACLVRLNAGDSVVYSQDGDNGWFVGGDRAFVGDEIITLRSKGMIKRVFDDDEDYRGLSARDVISEIGRAAINHYKRKGEE
jgi:hypothetical protein